MRVRRPTMALMLTTLLAGCASAPAGSYFAVPGDPASVRVAKTLERAAFAAGDDPTRYEFAFIKSRAAAVYSDEDATFYITDGLLRLPQPIVDAMVAHEVAHEVLGHIGWRRTVSLTLSASFGVLGAVFPGAGLIDFILNPLAVRAFSRSQELEADRKAVEILRGMGYPTPRHTLATALRTLDRVEPKPKQDLGGLLSTHPGLEQRLQALEPLEMPAPVANR